MKKLFTMIMCTFLIFQSIGCGYAMADNNDNMKSVKRVKKKVKCKTKIIKKRVKAAKIEAERDVKTAEIEHKNDSRQNLEKVDTSNNTPSYGITIGIMASVISFFFGLFLSIIFNYNY